MAVRVAFIHGMTSGVYYGGMLGFVYAVRYRQVRRIPQVALASGLTYGALLASSAWFRFDI
jgi:hypothetical protein